jgi:hypothetical protein
MADFPKDSSPREQLAWVLAQQLEMFGETPNPIDHQVELGDPEPRPPSAYAGLARLILCDIRDTIVQMNRGPARPAQRKPKVEDDEPDAQKDQEQGVDVSPQQVSEIEKIRKQIASYHGKFQRLKTSL